jgi:hypothetical protein
VSPHRPLALLLAAGAALGLASPALAASKKAERADLDVMVRNWYLGADLIPLAGAKDMAEFEQAAAQRFQTVQANDFTKRAAALAAEVAKHKPDLIGVQEAAVWKRSPDGVKDGMATAASITVYDSVTVMQEALRKRGLSYRVVVKRAWFDYEAPTALGHDVRLTQQDVVLVRSGKGAKKGLKLGRSFKGGFRDVLTVPTQAGPAASPRGWVGVDGSLNGRKFRFTTTHLEAYSPEIGDKQMAQLLAGPAKSRKTLQLLVGDFNSDPKTAGTDDRGAERKPNAYQTAIGAGFHNPLPRRNTCCFAETLTQTNESLDSWIDHAVTRPKVKVLRSSRIGTRQVGGMYPSDHAGIVARLRLR